MSYVEKQMRNTLFRGLKLLIEADSRGELELGKAWVNGILIGWNPELIVYLLIGIKLFIGLCESLCIN